MTLSGPDFISLQVDDLDRAERFYTEVIQMFTFVDPDGYRITVRDGR